MPEVGNHQPCEDCSPKSHLAIYFEKNMCRTCGDAICLSNQTLNTFEIVGLWQRLFIQKTAICNVGVTYLSCSGSNFIQH
jgi:hypothetical protein